MSKHYWYSEKHSEFLIKANESRLGEPFDQIKQNYFSHTSSQAKVDIDPIIFKSGCGSILTDIHGNDYIDLSTGIFVTSLGHNHPEISKALKNQLDDLIHCYDFMTPVKQEYLQELSNVLPGNMNYIHLYSEGSVAIEFAIRLAKAITGKTEVVSCFSDHHGKTLGATYLGRMPSGDIFQSRGSGYYLFPRPTPYRPLWTKENGEIDTDAYIDFYDLALKETTANNVAAFIIEPIQGWGGTIVPPEDFFPKLSDFCKSKDILLITDEILTGFGRTGKWLCTEHWNIQPDITVLGKSMGNGFPMSALVTNKKYADSFKKIAPTTTYAGNPLACTAGLVTTKLLHSGQFFQDSIKIENYLKKRLKLMQQKYVSIGDVRGVGGLFGIEFVQNRETKTPLMEASSIIYRECLKRKLIPGIPVINLLRIAPALIYDKEILSKAMDILDQSIGIMESELL